MPYVDGFVIAIAKKNLPAYRKMAALGCKVWKEHGALAYYECVGDDLAPAFGLPFPKLAKTKPSETVVFSWIVYKNKAHRNKVNKAVMADPRLTATMTKKMPFDVNRMAYGGFKSMLGYG